MYCIYNYPCNYSQSQFSSFKLPIKFFIFFILHFQLGPRTYIDTSNLFIRQGKELWTLHFQSVFSHPCQDRHSGMLQNGLCHGFLSLFNFLGLRVCVEKSIEELIALTQWFLFVKFYMVIQQVIVRSVPNVIMRTHLRELTIVMKCQTQRLYTVQSRTSILRLSFILFCCLVLVSYRLLQFCYQSFVY